ncbi:MAG: kelch repeat-containing protein, partial [Myxococcota bacterium]|nr:kelch repeat-containing protein [Myxococcota bacterium]
AAAPDAAAAADAAPGSCDPATPWASHPPLPLGPTQETAVVAVASKLYVLGGFHTDLGVVSAVQIFDPAACTWSMGPALPKPLHHINVASVGGAIYVLGALETLSFTATGEVWAWNPASETTWSARTAMPAGTQRGSSVVATIGDQIYVAGGLRNGAVADVSRFDPATNEWTALPALPAARDHACGGALDGRLVVAGGRQANITSTSPTLFAYAPGGAWSELAPMPTARGGTACGVLGDQLVVVGGEGNPDAPSGVFPQVEAYSATTTAWTTLAPMPTPRHGMGAAAIGGKLYVPGGATRQAFGAVATHEVLTP